MGRKPVKHGIIYLLTNAQLGARLVVSLYSLRQWYNGPITLFTTRPESHEIGALCAEDPRLGVQHERFVERPGRGYTSSYLTKTAILRATPYKKTVYLDADTIVCGSLDELFVALGSVELVATNFCGWTTMAAPTAVVLRHWYTLAKDPHNDTYDLERRLDRLLSEKYPSVNTGVFGLRRNRRLIDRWDTLSWSARSVSFPDEISLQLMLFETNHAVYGMRYNCHPLAWHGAHSPVVWHFVGLSHLQVAVCRRIWLPVYRECERRGIALLRLWSRVTGR